MKNKRLSTFVISALLMLCSPAVRGQVMSPELLWSLGRVNAVGLTANGQSLYYKVSTPDMEGNNFNSKTYRYDFANSSTTEVSTADGAPDKDTSPDGKWKLSVEKVKMLKVFGKDHYPDVPKSDAYVYDALHHRHWDSWRDGTYNHLMLHPADNPEKKTDLLEGEPYDCPTVPFGGSEDYAWSPDGTTIVYACKKLVGNDYVNSTNTDIYAYTVASGNTINLTADNPGYDTHPLYSSKGVLAWLSMARDGYEADKNDLKVLLNGKTINLTAKWDGTVDEFVWSTDGKSIYFSAPTKGTKQLFSVALPDAKGKQAEVKQITNGMWDVTGLVGQRGNTIITGRTDFNRAKELYSVDLSTGDMTQLTRVNDRTYAKLQISKVEARTMKTVDGKDMHVWVIYPPDFDPAKRYPALLYAQGGPQSALSQFYSFRWNFQLMAAKGYIIVAPNRRGMPGHGVEWNEQISTDWGGLNMMDYLTAIDVMAREPFVDESRLGCVGASYGGYSAFYLAGIHERRFKTFISHCGIVNLRSMYGNTEEQFFVNWDLGGPYWDKDIASAQRSFNEFNPIDRVGEWTSPMLIIQGGKDFRVPEGQAFEAFTAAQQRGVKSRLLYFPDENHWVLKPQNALVWQREFFKWLDETL